MVCAAAPRALGVCPLQAGGIGNSVRGVYRVGRVCRPLGVFEVVEWYLSLCVALISRIRGGGYRSARGTTKQQQPNDIKITTLRPARAQNTCSSHTALTYSCASLAVLVLQFEILVLFWSSKPTVDRGGGGGSYRQHAALAHPATG